MRSTPHKPDGFLSICSRQNSAHNSQRAPFACALTSFVGDTLAAELVVSDFQAPVENPSGHQRVLPFCFGFLTFRRTYTTSGSSPSSGTPSDNCSASLKKGRDNCPGSSDIFSVWWPKRSWFAMRICSVRFSRFSFSLSIYACWESRIMMSSCFPRLFNCPAVNFLSIRSAS